MALHEKAVIAVLRDPVIRSRNVPVRVDRQRPFKPVANEVQSVTHRVVVRDKRGERNAGVIRTRPTHLYEPSG